jgi:hypothetical protein
LGTTRVARINGGIGLDKAEIRNPTLVRANPETMPLVTV